MEDPRDAIIAALCILARAPPDLFSDDASRARYALMGALMVA